MFAKERRVVGINAWENGALGICPANQRLERKDFKVQGGRIP
jgi:hypothetical protein